MPDKHVSLKSMCKMFGYVQLCKGIYLFCSRVDLLEYSVYNLEILFIQTYTMSMYSPP